MKSFKFSFLLIRVQTTPLRNLLKNHKELEGWVPRGMGRLHNEGLDSDLQRSLFRQESTNIGVTTTYLGPRVFFRHDPPFVSVRFINSERDIGYTVQLAFKIKGLHVGVRTQMEYWFNFPFGRMRFCLQDGKEFMIDIGSMTTSNQQGVVPVTELLNLPLVHH